MKKKIIVGLSVLLLIAAAVYIYIRYNFLKAKDFKPDNSKAKSVLDLRPAIIAKLQQLVKDGSGGLYKLSIEKLNADMLASKADITNASITVDTAAMQVLDRSKKLPDDIFKIKFGTLHIDGIGIEDLLNKKKINIDGIYFTNPIIEVFHKNRIYNKEERKAADTLSLFEKLKGQANSITVGEINISHGTFINHNLQKNNSLTKFDDVSVDISNLLIDSSTQYDHSRFLFAKHAAINFKNYTYPTPDSLYFFKVGSISILGEERKIIAGDVELKPRGNKQQFESKLPSRKEMYRLHLPKIIFSNVNWWAMINHEKFIANEADVNKGNFYVYLDRSLPTGSGVTVNNFPQQMLMRIAAPISLTKLSLHNIDLSYEEFNPAIKRSATANFNNVTGTVNNISNIPLEIKNHPYLNFSGKGLFMNKVSMSAKFKLDLAKYRTGEFTADVHMDTLNNSVINPIAEPLALFSVKKGQMQKATAHIEGNNFGAKATLQFLYTDLHITPLKKDSGNNGKLKKKTFTSFFANTFLIKNSNPKNGNLRQPEYTVERGKHGNFFNFIWVSILTGILKTIGIPVKFMLK